MAEIHRPLFGSRSEPAGLMLQACSRSAFAATLGALAAVGFTEGWEPIYPLLPATLIGMAVTTALRVERFFSGLADHERRTTDAVGAVADHFAGEIAGLRQQLAATGFRNTGELEGAPVGAGAEPGTDEASSRSVPGNVIPLRSSKAPTEAVR